MQDRIDAAGSVRKFAGCSRKACRSPIVDSQSTYPQFNPKWYTFGLNPDVVTNCKILPGQKQFAEALQPKVA